MAQLHGTTGPKFEKKGLKRIADKYFFIDFGLLVVLSSRELL